MTKLHRAFRFPDEVYDKLIAMSEAKGKNLTDTLMEIIEQATRGEDPARYEWLDKACPALVHAEEGFHCFIKAPTKHKLGNGEIDDARKYCASCQSVRGKLDIIRALAQRGGVTEFYSCAMGGVTDQVDPDKVHCPYTFNLEHLISFTKDCKTHEKGQPCKNLQTHTIRIENVRPTTKR